MRQPTERVLTMVQEGTLSAEDGQLLLSAIEDSRPDPWEVLWRPLDHLGLSWSLLIATVLVLAGFAFLPFKVRFDGAFDMHFVSSVKLLDVGLDALVRWPLVALVAWGVAQLFARQGRLLDCLAFVGLASAPKMLAAVVAVTLRPDRATAGVVWILLYQITIELLWLWGFFLFYQGLRTTGGLKGGRLIGAFLTTVVLAEFVSKLIVSYSRTFF